MIMFTYLCSTTEVYKTDKNNRSSKFSNFCSCLFVDNMHNNLTEFQFEWNTIGGHAKGSEEMCIASMRASWKYHVVVIVNKKIKISLVINSYKIL